MKSNLNTVAPPDFSWAFSLLMAHILCYVLMLLAAFSGGAMMIYIIFLLPIYFCFLGAGLGVMAGKLKSWHLACLPETEAPNAETPAEIEIRTVARGLKWTFFAGLGLGAYFLANMQEGAVMLLAPVLISLAAAWITITGVTAKKGLSYQDIMQRQKVWNEMPRVRAQRVRSHNKLEVLKRVAIWVGPIIVLYLLVKGVAPDSMFEQVLRLGIFAGIVVATFWPNSRLPRYEPEPNDGLAAKHRMPRRRF